MSLKNICFNWWMDFNDIENIQTGRFALWLSRLVILVV